jgi:hypothetical protein
MSKMARNKGAAFERSCCKLIADQIGFECKRNLDQTREGGFDIELGQLFAIECKRYAAAAGGWFQPAWWEQTKRSAALSNLVPCLFYRYDRQPLRIVLPIYAINADYAMDSSQYDWPREGNACQPVVMDEETGFMVMREWLV